jgi:hypothetical protein
LKSAILAEDRKNNISRIYRRIGGGITKQRILALGYRYDDATTKRVLLDARERYQNVWDTNSRYPFLRLDSDTRMVNPLLAKKLNAIGREMRRFLWIGEGTRTRARQQELWDEYVNRHFRPPIVARPGTSRHETGDAADVSVFLNGLLQPYTNIGKIARARVLMRRHGVCLPVGGEKWHVEIGHNWRA